MHSLRPGHNAEFAAQALIGGTRIKFMSEIGDMVLKLTYIGKTSVNPVLHTFLYTMASVLKCLLTQIGFEKDALCYVSLWQTPHPDCDDLYVP